MISVTIIMIGLLKKKKNMADLIAIVPTTNDSKMPIK